MLVNMKGMLSDAAKGGYAVGGFNFASLESGMGAVRASEELGIPFVLEHAPAHEEYCPFDVAAPIMVQLAKAAKTPPMNPGATAMSLSTIPKCPWPSSWPTLRP